MAFDGQVPLFPGDSELQQLLHIFKLLGTPTEAEWAGVSKLRDWHEFPAWRKQDLSKHFPTLGADGIDLMELMFAYTPSQRITVRARPQTTCHELTVSLPRMVEKPDYHHQIHQIWELRPDLAITGMAHANADSPLLPSL